LGLGIAVALLIFAAAQRFLLLLAPCAAFAQQQASKHTCRILFLEGPDNAPRKKNPRMQYSDRRTDCQRVK